MLSDVEKIRFYKQGYLIRPGMLDTGRTKALTEEIDRYVEVERRFNGRNVWKYDRLCDLIVDPETLEIIDDIMARAFTFHHCHAARHDSGMPGMPWHHDYEQNPQTNRSHIQLHVMYYVNGLNGTVGDLLLLPRSHHSIMNRDAMAFLGDQEIPGTVVVNDIPPGTVIFTHSALLHARRPQQAESERKRYFIDTSFVQNGIQWPHYVHEGWQETLEALDRKMHIESRPELFSEDAFLPKKTDRIIWQD